MKWRAACGSARNNVARTAADDTLVTVANPLDGSAIAPYNVSAAKLLLFCDGTRNGIPWVTSFTLAGTYPLPWYGAFTAGTRRRRICSRRWCSKDGSFGSAST